MRRIKLVLATLVVLVAAVAAFAGPAMADDLNCRDARGKLIRCDGKLYEPFNRHYDDRGFYNYPYDYFNDYHYPYDYFNDYPYGYGFYDEVPVWTGYQWCEYDIEDNEYEC